MSLDSTLKHGVSQLHKGVRAKDGSAMISPTPFPELMARATKELPSPLDRHVDAYNERSEAQEHLYRRALAFFAAGGYECVQEMARIARNTGRWEAHRDFENLLRILDGVDAGMGGKEIKQS